MTLKEFLANFILLSIPISIISVLFYLQYKYVYLDVKESLDLNPIYEIVIGFAPFSLTPLFLTGLFILIWACENSNFGNK